MDNRRQLRNFAVAAASAPPICSNRNVKERMKKLRWAGVLIELMIVVVGNEQTFAPRRDCLIRLNPIKSR